MSSLEKVALRNQHVIFFDFIKIFDATDRKMWLISLNCYCNRCFALDWLHSYTGNRTHFVQVTHTSQLIPKLCVVYP